MAIGSITVNVSANNRRAVVLQGRTKRVVGYEGQDNFGHTLCGQGFILEDDTGSIEVLYVVRCLTTEVPVLVSEGEQVIVYATIDVMPTNIKNAEGKELVVKAMATKLVRAK